jgi:hypothetical protein
MGLGTPHLWWRSPLGWVTLQLNCRAPLVSLRCRTDRFEDPWPERGIESTRGYAWDQVSSGARTVIGDGPSEVTRRSVVSGSICDTGYELCPAAEAHLRLLPLLQTSPWRAASAVERQKHLHEALLRWVHQCRTNGLNSARDLDRTGGTRRVVAPVSCEGRCGMDRWMQTSPWGRALHTFPQNAQEAQL